MTEMASSPDLAALAADFARQSRSTFYVVRGRPDERQPLPAGHPITWGQLTQGTVLDDTAYPFPVFE